MLKTIYLISNKDNNGYSNGNIIIFNNVSVSTMIKIFIFMHKIPFKYSITLIYYYRIIMYLSPNFIVI